MLSVHGVPDGKIDMKYTHLFFCGCRVLVGRQAWIAMALSVATAITLQEVVSMQYPPGEKNQKPKKEKDVRHEACQPCHEAWKGGL